MALFPRGGTLTRLSAIGKTFFCFSSHNQNKISKCALSPVINFKLASRGLKGNFWGAKAKLHTPKISSFLGFNGNFYSVR